MLQELIEIRASLMALLRRVDQAINNTGQMPNSLIPAKAQLAWTLYNQIRTLYRQAGQPEPSNKQLRQLLMSRGWTFKRTEHGTLVSPPPVSDLP